MNRQPLTNNRVHPPPLQGPLHRWVTKSPGYRAQRRPAVHLPLLPPQGNPVHRLPMNNPDHGLLPRTNMIHQALTTSPDHGGIADNRDHRPPRAKLVRRPLSQKLARALPAHNLARGPPRQQQKEKKARGSWWSDNGADHRDKGR